MKIRTFPSSSKFVQFAIVIETMREARALISALIIGENSMTSFNEYDKTLVREIIHRIHLRGIEEI